MRPAAEPASVTLIIQKIGYDDNPLGRPYQVEKYEDFASKPFAPFALESDGWLEEQHIHAVWRGYWHFEH